MSDESGNFQSGWAGVPIPGTARDGKLGVTTGWLRDVMVGPKSVFVDQFPSFALDVRALCDAYEELHAHVFHGADELESELIAAQLGDEGHD